MATKKKEDYADPNDLIIIGLDTEDRGDHPLFDERAYLSADEGLVKNIMVSGIQQDVLVREEAGKLYVVTGRRRVVAAREAVKRQGQANGVVLKVPIKRVRADDAMVGFIIISENEQRLDDDVLTKARKAARHLALCKDENEVAIAFGRSITTIKNWLSLAQAHPKIHAAIKTGRITAAAGIELSRFPRKEQAKELDAILGAQQGAEPADPAPAGSDPAPPEDNGQAKGKGKGNAKKPKKPKPVSESAAKKHRAAAGTRRTQAGIKRAWLRDALKTQTAATLSDDQRAILNWFVTGQSEKGTWYDTFQFDAELEMAP